MTTLTKFKIYGERCSGTNYLENVILENFKVKLSNDHGIKHFFGFDEEQFATADDTLFICIVRDPIKWINSFYRELHQLPLKYIPMNEEEKKNKFLNDEFWSFYDTNGNKNVDITKERMHDRNIYTHNRYKNIFELRFTKLKYLLEDLPKKVKNYIFIRYEDLYSKFNRVIRQIKRKGLVVKDPATFPKNVLIYKKKKDKLFDPTEKVDTISAEEIKNNKNWEKYNKYEKQLGYI